MGITPSFYQNRPSLASQIRSRNSARVHQVNFKFENRSSQTILSPMSASPYRVTRATIDHLRELRPLWQAAELPFWELEKRVTEFQVVETPESCLLGAIGLQIADRQGRIHSEAFADSALADQLRPLLWERIRSVANNHGLVRLWTQEKVPFWSRNGLLPADTQALQQLPTPWKSLYPKWLTLRLREDVAPALSLDGEFALFMQSEKQRTEKAFQQARALKLIATLLAVGLVLFVIGAAIYLFRKTPGMSGR